jgi:hypothetical protein
MTATKDDVLLAILSLDAYNRGYGVGMVGVDGSQIGTATVGISSSVLPVDTEAASFYAQAYTLADGRTVISYRGTRFPGHPDYGDVLNGWALSLGYAPASQAQLAKAFYNEVTVQPA